MLEVIENRVLFGGEGEDREGFNLCLDSFLETVCLSQGKSLEVNYNSHTVALVEDVIEEGKVFNLLKNEWYVYLRSLGKAGIGKTQELFTFTGNMMLKIGGYGFLFNQFFEYIPVVSKIPVAIAVNLWIQDKSCTVILSSGGFLAVSNTLGSVNTVWEIGEYLYRELVVNENNRPAVNWMWENILY